MISLFIAGCGYVGSVVAMLAADKGWKVTCHLRDQEKALPFEAKGLATVIFPLDSIEEIPPLNLSGQTLLYSVPPQGGGSADLRARNFCAALERDNSIPDRIVYLSATSVYGDTGGKTVDENSPAEPTSVIGKRRLDAENVFGKFAGQHGIPLAILRVSGIYGPGRLPMMQISQGQPLLREDEARPSNRIHRDDLAQSCMAALEAGNGIYNISDGCPSSMTTYFNACADILGMPRQPQITLDEARKVMPPLLFSYFAESRVVDNSRMLSKLGVCLKYPSLEEGLKASV